MRRSSRRFWKLLKAPRTKAKKPRNAKVLKHAERQHNRAQRFEADMVQHQIDTWMSRGPGSSRTRRLRSSPETAVTVPSPNRAVADGGVVEGEQALVAGRAVYLGQQDPGALPAATNIMMTEREDARAACSLPSLTSTTSRHRTRLLEPAAPSASPDESTEPDDADSDADDPSNSSVEHLTRGPLVLPPELQWLCQRERESRDINRATAVAHLVADPVLLSASSYRPADPLHVQAEHAALVAALCRCLRASVGGVYLTSQGQLGMAWLPDHLFDWDELSFRPDVLGQVSFTHNRLRDQFRNWRAQEGGERI
ncbi:MAG: hypothetical protein M1826_001716 [Phylliscum demangeonii]|nr:MAG: hypothetical protein M1826_001716 [Phylliscum demangeonii]